MASRPPIVDRETWLQHRLALLDLEKSHSRQRDALARARSELPWVAVETDYVFSGVDGPVSLLELFDGRRQLIVYHFMYDPEWDNGCKSCSYVTDHLQGALPHIVHRDTSVAWVSLAPLAKLTAFSARMGWSHRWVSSADSSFNADFGVSFSRTATEPGDYNYGTLQVRGEMPGLSVFVRDGERIFHTYSTYSRGLDELMGTYVLLDLTPQGRDEAQTGAMGWVRRKDEY